MHTFQLLGNVCSKFNLNCVNNCSRRLCLRKRSWKIILDYIVDDGQTMIHSWDCCCRIISGMWLISGIIDQTHCFRQLYRVLENEIIWHFFWKSLTLKLKVRKWHEKTIQINKGTLRLLVQSRIDCLMPKCMPTRMWAMMIFRWTMKQ